MVIAEHPEVDHEDRVESGRIIQDRRAGKQRERQAPEISVASKPAPRNHATQHGAPRVWHPFVRSAPIMGARRHRVRCFCEAESQTVPLFPVPRTEFGPGVAGFTGF